MVAKPLAVLENIGHGRGFSRDLLKPGDGKMTMKHVCTLGACWLLVICLTTPALAELQGRDWPHYLGPQRTGVSEETGFVKEWDEPPVAWRKQIGIGFASMAAVGDRLYAVGNVDGTTETLFCLDAATGDEIWTASYPSELVDNLHEGGAGATPTVYDNFVFTVSRVGGVRCFDAETGEPVWELDLRTELEMQLPDWGFTSSVMIDDGVAYVQAGSTVAINPTNGRIVWKSTAYPAAYSTPQPFDFNGRRYLAVLNSFGLVVIDAADGSEVASVRWKGQFDTNGTNPQVLEGGRIFVSTGYGKGCGLYQLTDDGELEPIYRNRDLATQMDTALLYEGHFYGFNGNGNRRNIVDLVCMDAESGEVRWRHNDFGTGATLIADDTLIIVSDNGELAFANATADGYEQISRGRILDGRCWAKPTLAHGRLFVRDAEGELVCVDLRP